MIFRHLGKRLFHAKRACQSLAGPLVKPSKKLLLFFGSRSSGGGSRSCGSGISGIVLLLGLGGNREDHRAREASEFAAFRKLEGLGIERDVRLEIGDVHFEKSRDASRLGGEHEVAGLLREHAALSLDADRKTGELDRHADLDLGVFTDLDEVDVSDCLSDGILLVAVDDGGIAGLAIDFEVEKGVTLTRGENLADIDSANADVHRLLTLTIIDGRDLASLTKAGVVAALA